MTELEDLLYRTAEAFGVTAEELLQRNKLPHVVRARHAFCYIAYIRYAAMYTQIAGFLENRHHTTIMHSVKRGTLLRQDDADFAARIQAIIERSPIKCPPPAKDLQASAQLPNLPLAAKHRRALIVKYSHLQTRMTKLLNTALNGQRLDAEEVEETIANMQVFRDRFSEDVFSA